jgi:hypothetical protein
VFVKIRALRPVILTLSPGSLPALPLVPSRPCRIVDLRNTLPQHVRGIGIERTDSTLDVSIVETRPFAFAGPLPRRPYTSIPRRPGEAEREERKSHGLPCFPRAGLRCTRDAREKSGPEEAALSLPSAARSLSTKTFRP